jgi:hypothetical protein
MPKNQVSDPITDQEIAFAHLVLSGTMTDRRAAEAAGLNPDTAAYTKAKPRVSAYMLEHRAAVRERLVQQENDPQQRFRPDQSPRHDRRHRRPDPRSEYGSSRRILREEIRPAT